MWSHFIGRRRAALTCDIRPLAVGIAAAAICGGLSVQATAAADTPKPTLAYGTVDWAGLNWGLGIAADLDITGSRVVSANLVNNVVRVNDDSANVGVGFVLEAHYFLRDWPFFSNYRPDFAKAAPPNGCFVYSGNKAVDVLPGCTEVALGPFVAIEVGGGGSATPAANGPITAYALGVMVGLHQPSLDPKAQTRTWNFGIGLRIDPKAQVLGDGIIADQPLPVGETAIRYKTEPRLGVMLLSSFSF